MYAQIDYNQLHLKKYVTIHVEYLHCKDMSTDSQISQLLHLDLHDGILQLFCTEDTHARDWSLGRRFRDCQQVQFGGLFLMAEG